MNMKKTKVMWFQNTDKSTFPDVRYTINADGNVLSRVYSYQYLGVELDTLLSYNKHLESVVNKTTQKLFVFRKICRFISEKTAITVYKQMILPLLEYCNILFNSGKKTKLEKVDKIQSKCVPIIENCYDVTKRANKSDLCKLYNIESLQSRRDVQLACTMFRLSKFERYIDPTKSRDNLRSHNKIKFLCPFTRVSKIRNSPFYRGVDLWNSLRVEHHRAENKKRFKNLLKKKT